MKKYIFLLLSVFFLSCSTSDDGEENINVDEYGVFRLQYAFKLNGEYLSKTRTNEENDPINKCSNALDGMFFNNNSLPLDTLYLDFRYSEAHIDFYTDSRNQFHPKNPIIINHIEIINNFSDGFSNMITLRGMDVYSEDDEGNLNNITGNNFQVHYKSTNVNDLRNHVTFNCEDALSIRNFNVVFKKISNTPIQDRFSSKTVNKETFDRLNVGDTYELRSGIWTIIEKIKR